MPRRKSLSDTGVADLKPRAKRYAKPDPELSGHYIRVQPTGAKSYVAVAIDPRGKQVWHTVGGADLLTIEEAREKAREAIKAIKAGEDRGGPQSFAAVAENWFKRHVLNKERTLRSNAEIKRYLDKHILRAWAGREFASIRRGDVTKLLDEIEDDAGPVAADFALAIVRGLTNWYVTRHEDYVSPVVKGMRRSKPKDRARDRVLSEEELRAVWRAAEANGTFGAMVRLLLLTAQRREKVATMRWADVSLDGTWTIPAEAREKGNAKELVLSEAALTIIKTQPRFADNPYVFTGRGRSYFHGYSKAKAAFDAKLPELPQWQLHDLRRTARSLMSRAGVRPDIAERVLGHTIKGVEGVYDRHEYRAEKADALQKLAGLIDTIINPPVGNVVSFGGAQ